MRYEEVEWHAAACKGIYVNLFYLETVADGLAHTSELRRTCSSCPILEECLEYAMEHEHHGFWGGLTASERQKLRPRWKKSNRAA